MTFESQKLRAERFTIKGISTLLQRAQAPLATANELLLSTLAWSETYLWYLEIYLDELEAQIKSAEQPVTPPEKSGSSMKEHMDQWKRAMEDWTPLDEF